MDTKHARESYLTLRVAVVIPLLQAVVTAVLVGSVVGVVLYLIHQADMIPALLVTAFVASLAWISGLRWWRAMISSIDGKIERVPLHSYLEPVHPGGPDTVFGPPTVRVELLENGGRAGEYIELPCSPEKLTALARGLSDGKSFTESSWCGSGGIFTRSEFARLRDEMFKRKLLALNSPTTPARGYHLTRGGEACIRYLASTTPLLQDGSLGEF